MTVSFSELDRFDSAVKLHEIVSFGTSRLLGKLRLQIFTVHDLFRVKDTNMVAERARRSC